MAKHLRKCKHSNDRWAWISRQGGYIKGPVYQIESLDKDHTGKPFLRLLPVTRVTDSPINSAHKDEMLMGKVVKFVHPGDRLWWLAIPPRPFWPAHKHPFWRL